MPKKVEKKVAKKTKAAPLGAAKPKKGYSLEMDVNDTTYKTFAKDIHSALKDIEIPVFFKTDVILRIGNGQRTIEKYYKTFTARHVFANKTAIEILASNLTKEIG